VRADAERLTRLLPATARIAAIYGGSVGLLLVAELALSRTTSPAVFGEYQYVRQLLPFMVAGALFGWDQALTRHTAETGRDVALRPTLRRCILRMAGVSVIAVLGSAYLFDLSALTFAVLMSAPFALVVSELAAASWRARHAYGHAAFAQQGYRMFAGAAICVLVIFGFVPDQAPVVCLLTATVLVALWSGRQTVRRYAPDPSDAGGLNRLPTVAIGFGVSMLAFPGIDWADQAAVAYVFDGMTSSGQYAAAKLIAVYPFISIASIVGFIAMPEAVRRRRLMTPSWCVSVLCWASLVALPVWLVATGALSQVAPMILGRQVPAAALWTLTAVGVLRILYVIPSSVLGAVGSASLMVASGLFGCVGIALEILVIIFWPGDDPLLAGACGLLAATVIRLLVAHVTAMTAARRWATEAR
jgi:hypothetical protein